MIFYAFYSEKFGNMYINYDTCIWSINKNVVPYFSHRKATNTVTHFRNVDY